MEMLQWLSGAKTKLGVIALILVQGFISSNTWAYYDNKNIHLEAYTAQDLSLVIEDFQVKIKILEGHIQSAKRNIDWLVGKINRIEDSGRSVSWVMKNSVIKKEKRIQILNGKKKRLEDLLAKYRKIYVAKQNEMVSADKHKGIKPIATAVQKFPEVAQDTQGSFDKGKRVRIEAAVKKAGLGDWVDVVPSYDGCAKLENTLPILFSSGSASLAKEYQSFLKKLANFLKSYDVKVYVNGFADPDPIKTPRYPSNFELGASRAANVVHAMVKNGLKPGIFNIGSTGEYRFPAKNPSNKKSFQRRANLTVVFSG